MSRQGAVARGAGRWLLGVAAGAAFFEAIDALTTGSSSSLNGGPSGLLPNLLLWLPVVSPGLAGVLSAWVAPPRARFGLTAAIAAVWLRIGADRMVGIAQGAHLPPESGLLLILAFGVPWSITAVIGGGLVALARSVFRRHAA